MVEKGQEKNEVLGVIDSIMRTSILEGRYTVEDGIEDFGWTGIKCEVRTCPDRATEFWEGLSGDGDEGRNLCTLHDRLIRGWMMGLRRVRMRVCWDDGTQTEFERKGLRKTGS